ncbi:MAG TPA: choice-of-anchor D domain-containing protein [Solirubrobacterales bacterium]|nr:choice-of-anchor D domain-containing protein [Solirubrobacterales bacterium]
MKQAHTIRVPLLTGLITALALAAFPVAAQAGTLASSPPSVDFNPQPYFFGSQFDNLQISNSGTDTAVGIASITGPDAARFSFSGDGCSGSNLSDFQSCNVGVTFNPPNGPGDFTAQIVIPSSGSPPNPLVIPLSAHALAGANLVATPNRVNFGATTLGTTRSQQVTITNTGDFPGGVQQAFIVGPAEFTISNNQCSQQQLNPGQSCTLTALFTPLFKQELDGSIFAISGNTPEPVLPINLSGTGSLAGPAPSTRIKRRPKSRTRSNTASFQFTSTEAGVSFECKLDKESFAPCTSPSTYVVDRGRHSFQVRAKDADGTVDATPAKDKWRVKK